MLLSSLVERYIVSIIYRVLYAYSMFKSDSGDLRLEYLFSGFPDYWRAPGAQSHLHEPGVTGTGEVCLKFIPWVTPLNAGKLKELNQTNETPGRGGGSRKTTPPPQKKSLILIIIIYSIPIFK